MYNDTPRLTPRQQQFLDLLPKHNWIVLQAAIAAGYSQSYAEHHLMENIRKNPVLSKAIESLRTNAQRDSQEHQQEQEDLAERVIAELELIAFTKTHTPAETNAKIAALKLLGQTKALFMEKTQQEHTLNRVLPVHVDPQQRIFELQDQIKLLEQQRAAGTAIAGDDETALPPTSGGDGPNNRLCPPHDIT